MQLEAACSAAEIAEHVQLSPDARRRRIRQPAPEHADEWLELFGTVWKITYAETSRARSEEVNGGFIRTQKKGAARAAPCVAGRIGGYCSHAFIRLCMSVQTAALKFAHVPGGAVDRVLRLCDDFVDVRQRQRAWRLVTNIKRESARSDNFPPAVTYGNRLTA